MGKLRVISINFSFQNPEVVYEDKLATERALFDFDVVVIRPQRFGHLSEDHRIYKQIESTMNTKRIELNRLFAQGGVLVVLLDIPDTYRFDTGGYYSSGHIYTVNNYEFLRYNFMNCLRSGSGQQITYSDPAEPFVSVLKKSTVEWTAYVASAPEHPFNDLRFFAHAGAGAAVAGKMPYGEGHLVLLPNLKQLDEGLFFEACAEYRYKRQGSTPPGWVNQVALPGLPPLESKLESLAKRISDLQVTRKEVEQQLEELSAFRKLLYEKGKTQLEPIARRALDSLGFETKPGEIITGNLEIDGRTTKGSMVGIVEVKGSKKQIALDEFSPFVVKLLADHQATKVVSKGILVGNGLCETTPESRLDDAMFSPHVLEAARRNSVALINSVELYWVCCTLLEGGTMNKDAVREAILGGNGYIDLKPFCGRAPWNSSATPSAI